MARILCEQVLRQSSPRAIISINTMKVHVKNMLISLSPTASDLLLRVWHGSVRPIDHVVNRTHRISDQISRKHDGRVASGIFQGMRYAPTAFGSALLPKLVGSYEVELTPALNELLLVKPKVIIDIGSAEGYYAVGLALKLPSATVHAFDTSSAARALCRRLARMNGVADRVRVSGLCTHDTLNSLDLESSMIIRDCEGCESTLLDPALAPSLRRAYIIVELHEHLAEGTTSTLTGRFETSHEIHVVPVTERRLDAFPCIAELPESDQSLAVAEARVEGQSWLVMKPKRG